MMQMKPTRDAYGHALLEIAASESRVVVLDADLSRSTRTDWFANEYPERFINVGIAEANMIGMAAGLAMTGKIPFATTYSIFIGRAFDQIRQSVSYMGTNVKIVATHAGLAASYDGGSHQGLEDLALLRVLPGMTILSPADYHEAKQAILAAAAHQGPVYIRLQKEEMPVFTEESAAFQIGKARTLMEGTDVAILATGSLVYEAIQAAHRLREEGIFAEVLNISTIKPLDEAAVLNAAQKCGCLITAEEHNRIGGLYSAVSELLARHYPVPIEAVAMNDCYGETGSWRQLRDQYGLNAEGISTAVHTVIRHKNKQMEVTFR